MTARGWMIVLLAGVAMLLLWWRCSSLQTPDGRATRTSTGVTGPGAAPFEERADGDPRMQGPTRASGAAADEPAHAPALPAHAPALRARERVTFDRGPARAGEDPERHEDRVWFARHFDAFVREAGLSDEQAQAMLLAIYDFVTQQRRVREILDEERAGGATLPPGYLEDMFAPSMRELILAEQAVLTRDQRRVYLRECGFCAQRLALGSYHEPVLRLEGDVPR